MSFLMLIFIILNQYYQPINLDKSLNIKFQNPLQRQLIHQKQDSLLLSEKSKWTLDKKS